MSSRASSQTSVLSKEKLISPNIHALQLGYQFASEHFQCPLRLKLKSSDKTDSKILMDGNTAVGLGCVYGRHRRFLVSLDPLNLGSRCFWTVLPASADETSRLVSKNLALCRLKMNSPPLVSRLAQAGMARGLSLLPAGRISMQEFLGLAYFSEIPVVLFNIQRVSPSTGMPTRTQQGDLLSCAYASHGDTKHILLFPSTPKECFDFAASAFDIADQIQTPVIVMSDLELGMKQISEPLEWQEGRTYDRGEVLNHEQLEGLEHFGRYQDSDGDGIPYRTYPGTHPDKGSYFTRGSSHDANAAYTEDGDIYAEVMDRIAKKFDTALNYLPEPEIREKGAAIGLLYLGTTTSAIAEAQDLLTKHGVATDTLRVKSFPFHQSVRTFIDRHEKVYVIDQNRDAQLKSLLKIELNVNESQVQSIRSYNGVLITAEHISRSVLDS